ncbi:MAG: hypothetical protein AAFY58_00930, partial [Planctomycetota bacterium]
WAIAGISLIRPACSSSMYGAAGLYFVNKKEHGWVGSMVHDSSANYVGTAAFLDHAAHAGGVAEDATAPGHAGKGTFLGYDPHKVMYYVSAVVGAIGIGIAFFLHLLGRKHAETARADKLLPALGPIPKWAQNKWYVDELYNFLIVRPLWVISHIFHLIDKLFVDGLVNLFGLLPRFGGSAIRPSQSGVLHGYAVGMAGGVAILMLVVLVMVLG